METIKRRRDKRIWFVALGVFVAVSLFAFFVQRFDQREADAANMAGFDPGYIISDYQMGNYNSMSEAQIQAFLTSKNSCSTTNYNYYQSLSAGSSYTWHWANGHFVCLSEERFGDGEVIGSGDTAAHIIWQAAQDYRINPQVLIVLLQKETGLITDPIPNNGDYRKATGYGCPDTAACSSEYYGFKNQVRHAAALFRTVLDGGWTNYPLGNNYVKYNPNSACGGTVVNIRSLATSALYRYTPYQPNASALGSSYGYGDGCSSYGNRNFYSYFEDWFGGITYTGEASSIGRTIEDGVYQLISVENPGKAMNINGGVSSNAVSGDMDVYHRDTITMDGQQFKIEFDDRNGYYSIKDKKSELALDVKGNSFKNNTQVILWTQHDGCNQDWVFTPDDNGYYSIISRCSSKVLDVTTLDDLVIHDRSGSSSQKWMLAKIADSKGKVIEDGVYQLMPTIDNNEAIEVGENLGQGIASERVFINKRDTVDMDGQLFNIKYNNDGFYSIINVVTGSSLDVSGAGVKNSVKVGVWSQHDGCNQDWVIEKDGNNYVFYSRCSSKVLDITQTNKLIIYSNHGGNNQRWTLARVAESSSRVVEDGVYQISPKNNLGKVVDIKGGVWMGMLSGKTIIYNRNPSTTDNQLFEIKYNENSGYYNIINPTSGLVLDVSGASVINSTTLVVWPRHDGCNQDWVIKEKNEGYYEIISKCSSKALDFTSMNKLIIYDEHGGDNQIWKLDKK